MRWLLFILGVFFVVGCHLPKSTPLADCRMEEGKFSLRTGYIGRTGADEQVTGLVLAATYGLSNSSGLNTHFYAAKAEQEEVDGWLEEWGLGGDLILQLVKGEGGALAFYAGANAGEVRWKNFFEDDDGGVEIETESLTTVYLRAGFQGEVSVIDSFSVEGYFDLEMSFQWGLPLQYWTTGLNLIFDLTKERPSPRLFVGYSVTSVMETVLVDNYLITVGLQLRF